MSDKPTNWAAAAIVAVGNLGCIVLIFGSLAAWHYWSLPGFATTLLVAFGVIGIRVADTKSGSDA